jgi:hypothetical protein
MYYFQFLTDIYSSAVNMHPKQMHLSVMYYMW